MSASDPFLPEHRRRVRIIQEQSMAAHRCSPRSRAGFTLIELILVLVIAGLIVSLVAPAITSTTGLHLRTAAKRVAAGLRYARSQAITTGNVYQIAFDFDQNEMIIERVAARDAFSLPTDGPRGGESGTDAEEGEENSGATYEMKIYRLPKGVTIAGVVADGEEIREGEAMMEFYPNGSCSGGEVLLMDDKERVYRIAINFITGVVTIEEEET